MEQSRCRKCEQEKPATEFYPTPKDVCKPCYLDYQRRYYAANREKYRARDERQDRNKRAARNAIVTGLRNGSVKRQPCWVCGERAHAHHASYAEDMRLAVTWLCPTHHKEAHRTAS